MMAARRGAARALVSAPAPAPPAAAAAALALALAQSPARSPQLHPSLRPHLSSRRSASSCRIERPEAARLRRSQCGLACPRWKPCEPPPARARARVAELRRFPHCASTRSPQLVGSSRRRSATSCRIKRSEAARSRRSRCGGALPEFEARRASTPRHRARGAESRRMRHRASARSPRLVGCRASDRRLPVASGAGERHEPADLSRS